MRLQKILYNSQNNFKISENKIKIAHNEKTDKNYLKWTENAQNIIKVSKLL